MAISKKLFLSLLFLLILGEVYAQNQELEIFNQQRIQIDKIGMYTLGSWALGNIALSASLRGGAEGATRKFHEMNIYWNVFNLGIAGLGLMSALKSDPQGLSVYQSWQAQSRGEKILLFNAGLDVGYILGGLYLRERSKNTQKNSDTLKGFGNSIMLQGAFLMVFDLSMYFIHQGHLGRNQALFENVQLGLNSNGLGLNIRF